jgi:hypothetical protein
MKKFAIYLPQFHEIQENNRWWGDGFTEWVKVKEGKSLYKGHLQPKAPLNDNYYDLLDEKTVVWQDKLLKQYGIDGLIYYHYYFCGKKLLEKPAENLLKNKEIKHKFFFCWANHTWCRSWNGSKEVLMEQTYGTISDWKVHFDYLLEFFKDERYEKRNNKPLLMIHNSNFAEKKEMINYLNNRCKECGFNGICLIEVYRGARLKDCGTNFKEQLLPETELVYYREPEVAFNINKRKICNIPTHLIQKIKRIIINRTKISNPKVEKILERCTERYDGNKFFDIMIKEEPIGEGIVRGLFFEWDNTPRHSYRGYVIDPPDKKHFDAFMETVKNDEYIFINAWNEWAEGMMLEPTKQNEYRYLEWLKEW